MMLQYNFSNLIYVRNISPEVTEQTIRNFFGACDEVVSIEFKKFNQSDRRYCKIEFKTSTGITKASHMNGSLLLGCPLEITVTDPTLLMQDKQDGVAAGQNGILSQQQQQVDAEEMHKSRCVKISNLPHKYDRIDVYTLLGSIGTIVSCRLETSQGTRSATVEFKSCFEANEALKMTGVAVGTNVLKVIKVVPPRQSNVQLQVAPAVTSVISTAASSRNDLDLPTEPARSAVFNEKLAKVLEMRERIHRKLANRTDASAPGVVKPRAADENENNGWWSRHKSESQQQQQRRHSRRRSKSTSLSSSSKSVLRNQGAKSTRDKQENVKDDEKKLSSSPSRSRKYSRGKSQRSLSTASDASRGKSRRHRHRHEKHHRRHRSSHSRSRRHHHHRRHRHRHRHDSSSPSRSRSRSRSFASRHSKSSRR